MVHATSFLRTGGRLALVLPAELLSVNYAAPVRRFLLDHFAEVRVVLFEERVFPGVIEEVVLLLAEGQGPCDHFDLFQVANEVGYHLPDLAPVRVPEVLAPGEYDWDQNLQIFGDLVLPMVFAPNEVELMSQVLSPQWTAIRVVRLR